MATRSKLNILLKKITAYFLLFYRLGFINILNVFFYRFLKIIGYYELFFPIQKIQFPEVLVDEKYKYFHQNKKFLTENNKISCLNKADQILDGTFSWFSNNKYNVGFPPDWFEDPVTRKNFNNFNHWSKIKFFQDFDIKRLWELSRWCWAPILARAYKLSRDEKYKICLENLINDWCEKNKLNQGQNWVCAQEVSIRLINFFQMCIILEGNKKPLITRNRKKFITQHLNRIMVTTNYAKSQKNNHSISEGSALFIGGNMLNNDHIAKKGIRLIEFNLKSLVCEDGSFSQYSTNYHRFVIDTICQLEIWRKILDLPKFSADLNRKIILLINWLDNFVDPISGKAPNLGGNDGVYCYQLHSNSYRNFKPSLQLGNLLFKKKFKYLSDEWNEQIFWLDLNINELQEFNEKNNEEYNERIIANYPDGGFTIIRPSKNNWGLLRRPIYKFRPSQADPLHFDLWSNGINLLRDGGSYSYNTNPFYINYFSGIKSHNSIQFNDLEPMKKITRFLWIGWLEEYARIGKNINHNKFPVSSSYKFNKIFHQRAISFEDNGQIWKVHDRLRNFEKAILRWRLPPVDLQVKGNKIESSMFTISIKSKAPLKDLKIVNGWESVFYDEKKKIPVLEVILNKNNFEIQTEIKIKL